MWWINSCREHPSNRISTPRQVTSRRCPQILRRTTPLSSRGARTTQEITSTNGSRGIEQEATKVTEAFSVSSVSSVFYSLFLEAAGIIHTAPTQSAPATQMGITELPLCYLCFLLFDELPDRPSRRRKAEVISWVSLHPWNQLMPPRSAAADGSASADVRRLNRTA
jgi:hypothetical protein